LGEYKLSNTLKPRTNAVGKEAMAWKSQAVWRDELHIFAVGLVDAVAIVAVGNIDNKTNRFSPSTVDHCL
jgi:hypothetical protein